MKTPAYPPRATLRLQFNHGFTLDDAVGVVDWAADLGISHVYASPLLTARAGSTHGYDTVDHSSINPELGGEAALRRLVAALRAQGMGLILDIVPNHMAVGGHDNTWWLDVLEWGRGSPYAAFFDIDFDPPDAALRDKVLAPFLGDGYGACLRRGEIVLRVNAGSGSLDAWYHDHRLPIRPQDYANVLITTVKPANGCVDRAAAQAMRGVVRDAAHGNQAAIANDLAHFAAGTPDGTARLHALLERQHYRLAWWRTAAEEINWRRFFDINALAGLRVELPHVFDATHALIFRLYVEGLIDGVRVDHIDGLAEPRAYCRKLRRRLSALTAQRPAVAGHAPPLIWVEKILAPGETLPRDWLVDGPTGYDFMDQVGAVLHDPAGAAPLKRMWTDRTGRPADFRVEERAARRQILHEVLPSELNATAASVHRIARQDPATRDLTLGAIRRALVELLVHFRVYRLYAGAVGPTEADARVMAAALAGAMNTCRRGDREVVEAIARWLGAGPSRAAPVGRPGAGQREERRRARVRFQQLSAPTAAKSVEDTAFYRYGVLLSRNEVGSDPANFAIRPDDFHAACAARLEAFPRALLATATHDHKRGEDVRARLAIVSEWPEAWAALVDAVEMALPHASVDPGDRLMLLQMLVGAWPAVLDRGDEAGIAAFRERIAGWQQKALREAKLRTDWATPDLDYEAACHGDLAALLAPGAAREAIAAFAVRLMVPGMINALSQSFLRLTTPGIPDLYQGAALWDESLVDPDNRRVPDFAALRDLARRGLPPVNESRSGAVKLAMIARVLRLRRETPGVFADGGYESVVVEGPRADHVVAFLRCDGPSRWLCAAVRLPGALVDRAATPAMPAPAIPPAVWHGTTLVLPAGTQGRELVTGRDLGPAITPAALFAHLPVALVALD
ncbi:MAG TPA: malto-oligosyltrehalose synthase [Acetobacteraceae bacterium]|jgi:(1->4)-alpha-D-glucan 1-alpha-D-glucosylmutase|nr:malto-oligosyltrehalose synthase [Acetobacteraceae bacterium]